jgi:tetratricopeptide (TPR) repeat protein
MHFEHWRHYARGWLFHFFGREDTAFTAWNEAFRLDPMDVQAARHLAAIAARREQFDVAEKWFEAALALAPEDSANWFNLGFVRERAGDPTGAVAAFGEATRLAPRQDRAWFGLGLAHARLGRHGQAAAALEQAVALQPLNGEGFYHLGMAYHHAELPREVTRVVKRLVDFEPRRARMLARDTARADLMELIPELPF